MTSAGDVGPYRPTSDNGPDPTTLTSLLVQQSSEQSRRDLASAVETINTRLKAMGEASALKMDLIRQIRPETDAQIEHLRLQGERVVEHLRQLHEVKFEELGQRVDVRFDAIDQRFLERDIRTEQAALASKQALDAALQAAKELVQQQNEAASAAAAVMIANFTKLIDQLGIRLESIQKTYDDRLLEIKERIDRGEGSHQGAVETRTVIAETATARRGESSLQWQTIAVLAALAGLVLTLVRLRTG
jgi:hypothetical protein